MAEGPDHRRRDGIDKLDSESTVVRFLFEPSSGSVEYATRNGRGWLTPKRHKLVEEIVADLDFDDDEATRVCRDGYRFRLYPMFGALGQRVLVTVSEADDAPSAADLLTDRQLEVAEYAASGATGPEIAETLGVEPSTIYDHLQKIYDRLEIGSRAELTRAVIGD